MDGKIFCIVSSGLLCSNETKFYTVVRYVRDSLIFNKNQEQRAVLEDVFAVLNEGFLCLLTIKRLPNIRIIMNKEKNYEGMLQVRNDSGST